MNIKADFNLQSLSYMFVVYLFRQGEVITTQLNSVNLAAAIRAFRALF